METEEWEGRQTYRRKEWEAMKMERRGVGRDEGGRKRSGKRFRVRGTTEREIEMVMCRNDNMRPRTGAIHTTPEL